MSDVTRRQAQASGATRRPAWQAWLWATRPFSLTASVVPVLVGSALAWHEALAFDAVVLALALVGSVAIQVGANLTDEYADYRRHGAAKFPAPHKVIQRGEFSPRAVLMAMAITFSIGVVCGLVIVARLGVANDGWPVLAVGLASVAVAYFYSAGPYPIGNLGLGELTVSVFMGPLMVMAAFYVQAHEVTMTVFWVSLPVAFLVTAIMHCNNLRDMDEDRAQGKRSLAALLGGRRARVLYAALVAAAYVSLAAVVVSGVAPVRALLALATLPLAAGTVRLLYTATDRRAMNRVLVRTAALHFTAGVLLTAGLVVG